MDSLQKSFETQPISEAHPAEVGAISKDIEAKSAEYADQGLIKEKREIIKDVLGQQAALPPTSATPTDEHIATEAEKIKTAKKEEQLQTVMRYASTHGPIKASLLVKKTGDAWLEDQFHDEIIKLHEEFSQKSNN